MGRLSVIAALTMLLVIPVSCAYWQAWLRVDNAAYNWRKYSDDLELLDWFNYNIPDWDLYDTKAVRTEVEKTNALSEDWAVIQHTSVLSNMQITTDPDADTEGGAVLLFTSGGFGYQHFAARFRFRLGYSTSRSYTGMPVQAVQTGQGKIHVNIICWEYGGDPYEDPESPTTLLYWDHYFDIVS